jgi:DNA primase
MKEKINILNSILGKYYSSGDELLFSCPYCGHHKKKFSVNIEKNAYKCWICDTRGKNLFRVINKFGNFSQKEKWKELTGNVQDLSEFDNIFSIDNKAEESREEILSLPKFFVTLTSDRDNLQHKKALNYLNNRGISRQDILRWKIGYCPHGPFGGRVIIPSFNNSGDLNYFIARTYKEDYRRYMNPKVSRNIIFNELYVDFEKEITIVEGVFDAIKAGNAVPILGSSIRESSKLFKKIVENETPVILALDPDARKKSDFIKKMFLNYGIEIKELIYPDERDLGDMTKEEVFELKKKAQPVGHHDNLLSAIAAL